MSHHSCCCGGGCTPLKGVWCGTPPSCSWTTAPDRYFCDSVVVSGTTDPIEPGQVIKYKGLCYSLTDAFVPPDPLVIEHVTEVELVGTASGGACASEACGGPWYYTAFPCEHNTGVHVLVEYCAAQAILAGANIPGVQAVQCIVFKHDGYCYHLDVQNFSGNLGPDPGLPTITSSAIGLYRNCCHCNSTRIDALACVSNETTVPNPGRVCWQGDPQGGCCGRSFLTTWSITLRVELFSEGLKYHDDTIDAGGSFILGPPQACGVDQVGLQARCSPDSFFKRTLIQFGSTFNYSFSPCANWPFAEDITVNPPVGCGGRQETICHAGFQLVVGGNFYNPLSWVVQADPMFLLRVFTINGHTFETDCSFSGRETSAPDAWVDASWSISNSTGGGHFSYSYEVVSGGVLVERGSFEADYTVQTIIPCERCEGSIDFAPVPEEGAGDMAAAAPAGCATCGAGGEIDEPTEVL